MVHHQIIHKLHIIKYIFKQGMTTAQNHIPVHDAIINQYNRVD